MPVVVTMPYRTELVSWLIFGDDLHMNVQKVHGGDKRVLDMAFRVYCSRLNYAEKDQDSYFRRTGIHGLVD